MRKLCRSSESFHWGFLSITPSPFSLKMTTSWPLMATKSHKMKLDGMTHVIVSGFPFQPWDSSMSHCISSLSILCIFPHMNTFIYHTLLKESACKSRRCERPKFNPWVRKISWRRKWQSTPAFLPGKFHGQGSLVDFSPWGHKESDTTEHSSTTVRFSKTKRSQYPCPQHTPPSPAAF